MVLNSDIKNFANSRLSASNFKSFSLSLEQFFLTVGQNNFGNKIPFNHKLFFLNIIFYQMTCNFFKIIFYKIKYSFNFVNYLLCLKHYKHRSQHCLQWFLLLSVFLCLQFRLHWMSILLKYKNSYLGFPKPKLNLKYSFVNVERF